MTLGLRIILFSSVLFLFACKVDLYSKLNEQDANQMLALLLTNNISAVKDIDKSGGLILRVEQDDFVKAVEILRQNGYPRPSYQSVDDLFPTGQLITSPTQEKAKVIYLREQGLEKMLVNIEGVISANVVIAQSLDDENTDTVFGSVSVLIKYSPEVNMQGFSGQIKDLIHNSIPSVAFDNITLVLQPVSYRFISQSLDINSEFAGHQQTSDQTNNNDIKWSLMAAVITLLSVCAFGLLMILRRRRHLTEDN